MDIEEYFAPAIELCTLMQAHQLADPCEKPALSQKIHNSQYLVHLRMMQIHAEKDYISGIPSNKPLTNASKRTFFLNTAVPSARTDDDKPPAGMPYHRHDYIELIVILRGSYLHVVNGCEYRHKEGDVCMVSPNVAHRDFVPRFDERILYIGLSKSYLHGELATFFNKHPHLRNFMKYQNITDTLQFILFHSDNTARLTELCMQIAEEDLKNQTGHHLMIKGLLVRLFDLLLQNHQTETICKSTKEIQQTLIAEMLDYMQGHIATINRSEMAEFFHFNPDYLNRLLIRTTGLTFSQNVREIRLQSAARLLVESKMSVNAIIVELGFSNKSYFNRIFGERYGVLPGKYRLL